MAGGNLMLLVLWILDTVNVILFFAKEDVLSSEDVRVVCRTTLTSWPWFTRSPRPSQPSSHRLNHTLSSPPCSPCAAELITPSVLNSRCCLRPSALTFCLCTKHTLPSSTHHFGLTSIPPEAFPVSLRPLSPTLLSVSALQYIINLVESRFLIVFVPMRLWALFSRRHFSCLTHNPEKKHVYLVGHLCSGYIEVHKQIL